MRALISLGVVSVVVFVLLRLGILEVKNKNGVVTARVNWNS